MLAARLNGFIGRSSDFSRRQAMPWELFGPQGFRQTELYGVAEQLDKLWVEL